MDRDHQKTTDPCRYTEEELRHRLDSFEQAWQSEPPADLDEFLEPPCSDTGEWGRVELLVELIMLDLEYRWRSVNKKDVAHDQTIPLRSVTTESFPAKPTLEEYVKRYPELGPLSAIPARLAAEEYRVRHRWGDRPSHQEYFGRFGKSKQLVHALEQIDTHLQVRPNSNIGGLAVSQADDQGAVERRQRIRQIVNDCIGQRAAGAQISDESLIEAYPDLMPELGEELRNLLMIQEAERQADDAATVEQQGLRIRCPHCQQPVEIVDEVALSDVVCSSCGSHFSLVDEPQTFQAGRLESVGHFKLLDKLGFGAFGSVWSARDTELDRLVAVKIPRKGQMSPEDTEQFLREARAAAQLNHPNIIRVNEVGREGDRVYIVTDLVEGVDLADWLTEQRPTPREAAELCAKVADALDHAHEHGVIHRDLKPQNIMLDTAGEPHLMDFGLAKREAAEITMTVDGKLLGTPAYMSPEQARGAAHQADRRSDVYSLGVILFELLTGERPFRGSTRMLLHQVLVDDAPSPRKLNGSIPKDLETICLKCLEKDPNRRYQTAGRLAEDLRRFLRAEPVQARPITAAARALRWCRRKPVVAGLTAAVAGLLLFLGIAGPIVAVRQTRLKSAAERAEREVQWRLYVSDMDSAREVWERSDVTAIQEVHKLLKQHQPAPGQPDLRGLEWYYLWRLCMPGITALTLDHGDHRQMSHLAFSEQGTTLATVSAYGIRHWSLDGPRITLSRKIDATGISGRTAKLSPDLKTLALGYYDGSVTLTNFETGESQTLQGHVNQFDSLAFSPTEPILARGDEAGTVRIWNLKTGKERTLTSAHDDLVYCVAFSPDGNILATGSEDGAAKLWHVDSGKLRNHFDLKPLVESKSSVWSVAFSPDCRTVAMGTSGDGVVMIYDVDGTQPIHELGGHGRFVPAITFSPDGTMLASVADSLINLWDVHSGQLKQTLKGHLTAVYSLAFSPEGNTLASGDYHGTVKLWNIKEVVTEDTLRHSDMVHCVAFSPRNMMLASVSHAGELTLWDVSKNGSKRRLKGHGSTEVAAVSFSPDGHTLASSGKETVKLWNVASGDIVSTFPQNEIVWSLAYAPNGKTLALGSADGTVTLLDLITGATKPLGQHGYRVFSLTFSPKEDKTKTLLASACANWGSAPVTDHTVRLWNWKSGQLEKVLEGHTYGVPTLAFSPDGDKFVTASGDGTMRVWDTTNWNVLRHIDIAKHDWQRATFTPDGRVLILASGGRPVQFWDATTWKLRFQLPTHNVMSMALSSDGTVLATGGDDETVRLYRMATREEIQAAGW